MALNVTSTREEFAGFGEYYESVLEPFLAERDIERRIALQKAAAFFGIGLAIVILSMVLVKGDYGFIGAALAFMLGVGAANAQLSKIRNRVTSGLFSHISERLKLGYRRKCGRPDYAGSFLRLGLLPKFTIEDWEDNLCGQRRGADFDLIEGHLKIRTSGKNKKVKTVFHGQLLMIDYHEEFLGETVLMRDNWLLNSFSKPGKRFQRVGLASPKFEKIFEAWATDQVEARTLLDPVVLERFEELDRLFEKAKLRAAFSEGKLLIALETGDKLNSGSMFRPLNQPERVENILKELDLIYDLIDVATQKIDGRMYGPVSVEAVR